MEPRNPVLPDEGRWLSGDASARASEETGVQVDAVQTRLGELLGKFGKPGIPDQYTLQATQIPLNEEQPETDWWTTDATEPQRQKDDDAWWDGNHQWSGQGWSRSSKCILGQHHANEQSHDCADVEWRRKTL